MPCLPQLGSVPAAYAVVAAVIGLSNKDVISLRSLRCVRWMEIPLKLILSDVFVRIYN